MDYSIKLEVYIKDKMYIINAGDGAQTIKWLCDLAIYRYDNTYGMITGPTKGLKLESGALLPMDGIISQNLENDQKVWVLLTEDLDNIPKTNAKGGNLKKIILNKYKR